MTKAHLMRIRIIIHPSIYYLILHIPADVKKKNSHLKIIHRHFALKCRCLGHVAAPPDYRTDRD